MATRYWLVKQEPEAYPWSQLVADKKTVWTGVRNFQARNHLRAMKTGMRCSTTTVSPASKLSA